MGRPLIRVGVMDELETDIQNTTEKNGRNKEGSTSGTSGEVPAGIPRSHASMHSSLPGGGVHPGGGVTTPAAVTWKDLETPPIVRVPVRE